ncbi:cactus-binding C-terminus of cactin protein-domain-containing protein [Fimicolochytrium jonesii]|uniref:cactus-binding C-terminus of cactin protein-domain-containing protein n=1 Tax=Fimicolochytrium jonesii TaxID=1396493 RepID=UPI0022FF3789|nr:cactus-binding C-terminus of cactin protein-domain-containing protein [Fimicolochytrium jonesii]KAI8820011.1 cactus-binding C-terminus of cactin protein-domain-containing protein [Fimicolochytrium jonesii]
MGDRYKSHRDRSRSTSLPRRGDSETLRRDRRDDKSRDWDRDWDDDRRRGRDRSVEDDRVRRRRDDSRDHRGSRNRSPVVSEDGGGRRRRGGDERGRGSDSGSVSSDSEHDRSRKRKRTSKAEKRDDRSGSRSGSKSKSSSKKPKKQRETSVEKKIRKAERKLEKQQLKDEIQAQKESQLAAQMSASLGYSNTENPFGDSNLSNKFLWLKKREKESKSGLSAAERARRDMSRREEVEDELSKLKRRRNEREIEMQLREEEQARLQREQDRLALGDWEAKENEFHLGQAKTRAQIRIKEGRAKPIDILAMNLSLASDTKLAEEFDALGLEMGVEEPYLIFRNLSLPEVEELHKDIQLYLSLETDHTNKRFWEAMIVVCDDELSRHREDLSSGGRSSGVSKAVTQDIERMFSNKTYDQLSILQTQIEKKLAAAGAAAAALTGASSMSEPAPPVDVDYWEAAIKALVVWKAKAKLRDMHSFLLSKRLDRLREQRALNQDSGASQQPRILVQHVRSGRADVEEDEMDVDVGGREEEEESDGEVEEYEESMGPVVCGRIPKADAGFEVVDEEEDLRQLIALREKVTKALGGPPAHQALALVGANQSMEDVAEKAFIRDAAENMGMDEAAFNEEAVVISASQDTYLWQDKYRPRKPRYFNRVHTGYEWNKYNQTHYDGDNPPPKVVQGYKFNIFYPDLIDKSIAPTYVREKDPTSTSTAVDPTDPTNSKAQDDTIILRFKAGPPYEDIAFKIVNREWEYSHKKGFRSSFDRGVLQLWFHFKRHYYRR